jgi:hypothetical protein
MMSGSNCLCFNSHASFRVFSEIIFESDAHFNRSTRCRSGNPTAVALSCFRFVVLRPPLSESLPLIIIACSLLIIGTQSKNFRVFQKIKKFSSKFQKGYKKSIF